MFVALTTVALVCEPRQRGDGFEYLAVTTAVANHATPDVRVRDAVELTSLAEISPIDEWETDHPALFAEGLRARRPEIFGFFRTKGGAYFGYHFFAYSAICAPAFLALEALGRSPLAAFAVTNAFLITAVLGWLWFRMRAGLWERFWIGTLYVFGGSLYYLLWPHPDVFVTGMLAVAFGALATHAPRTSLVAFGLAALQTQSLAILQLSVPIIELLRAEGSFRARAAALRPHAPFVVAFGIPLVPPAFYFSNYGVINLILARGFADSHLVTVRRLASLYFDFDQGMVVGIPWLPVLWVVAMVEACRKPNRTRLVVSIVAAITSCAIAAPLLSQVNWNAGSAVFSRYALLAAVPWTTWAGLIVARRVGGRELGVSVVLMLIWVTAQNDAWATTNWSHITPSRLSRFFYQRLPQVYNPEPEVFVDRILASEAFHPGFDRAVAFRNSDAMIRKIVFPLGRGDSALRELCEGGDVVDSRSLVVRRAHDAVAIQHGWGYLNGSLLCSSDLVSPGEVLSADSPKLHWDGWGDSESTHRWSTAVSAAIRFQTGHVDRFRGEATFSMFVLPPQSVVIALNGHEVIQRRLDRDTSDLSVRFDPRWLKRANNLLTFRLPDARSPGANDPRTLAIALRSMTLR